MYAIIIIIVVVILLKRNKAKTYRITTPVANEKKELRTCQASSADYKTQNTSSSTEITSQYFDMRMNLVLKNLYKEDLRYWEYPNSTSLKYRNKENDVIVYFKDGKSKKITVFTENVWGKRMQEEELPTPEPPQLTPAQKWLLKHGAKIEELIQKAIAENNGVELSYPLSADAEGIEKDIIRLMEKNTVYNVVLYEKKLQINFQALCEPDM